MHKSGDESARRLREKSPSLSPISLTDRQRSVAACVVSPAAVRDGGEGTVLVLVPGGFLERDPGSAADGLALSPSRARLGTACDTHIAPMQTATIANEIRILRFALCRLPKNLTHCRFGAPRLTENHRPDPMRGPNSNLIRRTAAYGAGVGIV